jgi:hypothetical protein
MKKVFTIIITTIMLASGMHVSIDHHYCGGKPAGTKLSLTAKLASCGMEAQEHSCSNQLFFENKCCDDQLTFYSLGSNYFPEDSKLSPPFSGKKISATHVLNVVYSSPDHHDFNIRVLPPGNKSWSGVSLSRICILLI